MKDPAFLFYDGDAARDVSHMNRLERGCYFDLIQAQRKFGGYTMEQARKILGRDFEECWPSIEMVLSCDNGRYYIDWVENSANKRKEYAEKQRVRIQNYWDDKKEKENNHGNTTVLPLVNENVIEYTYSKFYDCEIEKSNNDSNYIQFVKVLFGDNPLSMPLNNVLSLPKQVTFEQYKRIHKFKQENNIPITPTLVSMDNHKDLKKKYVCVQATLLNWLKPKK